MTESLTPQPVKERIVSLDVLRGFAVLGILVMNIQSFSMVTAAYINPAAYGDLSGVNKWAWIFSHIFADMKFMTLFSVLFGAGIILFTQRTSQKLKLHFRRMIWLLLFGLLHAYLLWYGDILVSYALCGLVVVLMRNMKPKILLIAGFIAIAIPSILYLLFGMMIPFIPPEGLEGMNISWQSTPQLIAKELETYRSSWTEQMGQRIPGAVFFQTSLFLMMNAWRAGGLMLIGMSLFKWNILNAGKRPAIYRLFIFFGFIVGFTLVILGIIRNFNAGWTLEYSMFIGSQFNYWGSLAVAAGYLGVIMLFSQSYTKTWLGKALAATGRMAFSNYIMQSLICTYIFYGHGMGLYGSVERSWQLLIALIIVLVQLIISPLWLKKFRFGPLEWLWRSLTYLKWQQIMV